LQHDEGHQRDDREGADKQDRNPFDQPVATDREEHRSDSTHDDGPDRFVGRRRLDECRFASGVEPGLDRIGLRRIATPPCCRLRHTHVGRLVVRPVPHPPGRCEGETAGERLGHARKNSPLLNHHEHCHDHPAPVDPAQPTEPGAGHTVEGVKRRAAPRERCPTNLDLGRHLDRTAEDHQPQQHEACLGTDDRRRDEFTAADDGTGEDDPRTEM